jgi:hypothetical protein
MSLGRCARAGAEGLGHLCGTRGLNAAVSRRQFARCATVTRLEYDPPAQNTRISRSNRDIKANALYVQVNLHLDAQR